MTENAIHNGDDYTRQTVTFKRGNSRLRWIDYDAKANVFSIVDKGRVSAGDAVSVPLWFKEPLFSAGFLAA